MRQETVYLVDQYGNPYMMVDTRQDRYVLDENDVPTEEVESVLVASFRRNEADEEISEAEYNEMLPAYEAAVAAHQAEMEQFLNDCASEHAEATNRAVAKLSELGLTAEEAAAVAGLPAESFEALGVGRDAD